MPCFTQRASDRIARKPQSMGSDGFALVIALSLMAFTILILSTFSFQIIIQTRAAAQSKEEEIAKQNALLALQIALGQLQQLAGPDQRITASAGLDGSTSTGARRWTGVWESRDTGGPSENFLGWLTSIPGNIPEEDRGAWVADAPGLSGGPGAFESADEDWVLLVGEGSVDVEADPEAAVLVPKVSLPTELPSNFAYWIGDEGTKARVNLSYDPALFDPSDFRTPAPISGIQEIDGDDFSAITRNSAEVGRTQSLTDFAFFADPAPGSEYFHDLTFHSRGLLTDTRRGGLRRDLTHLFENDTAFERVFGTPQTAANLLGTTEAAWSGGGTPFPHGGPNWSILREFHNLHEITVGGISIPRTLNNRVFDEATHKTTYSKPPEIVTYNDERETHHTNSPAHPLVSWFQIGIGMEYLSDTETDPESGETITTYYPRLHIRPVIALYNPYDIEISAADYFVRPWYMPIVRIQLDGKDAVAFGLHEIMPPPASAGLYFRWRINDADFRPGETRYFSLDQPYLLSSSAGARSMIPDWSEDGTFYVDITRDPVVQAASSPGPTFSTRTTTSTMGLTSAEKASLEYTDETSLPDLVNFSVIYRNTQDEFGLSPRRAVSRFPVLHKKVTIPFLQGNEMVAMGSEEGPDDFSKDYPPDQIGAFTSLSTLGFGLRTPSDSDQPHRQFVDANLRAYRIARGDEGDEFPLPPGWSGQFEQTEGAFEPEASGPRYTGFFGSDRSGDPGAKTAIFFHVPRESPLSMGLFQHANLGKFTRHPTYIVGQSYALGRIPLGDTSVADDYLYDWPYLINRELWDTYYLSGIPQDLTDAGLADYRSGSAIAPNPRLSFHQPKGLNLDSSVLTDPDAPETAQSAAGRQMIEGAFNINSLSVPAWKAFLGSNAGLAIPTYNPETGAVTTTSVEEGTFYFRTPVPYGNGSETNTADGSFWNTHRRLGDDELTDLATAMVEEVRARGPFSSLSDFINRRLVGADDQRRRGALQAALDKTVNTNLNASLTGSESGTDLLPADSGFENGTLSPEDRPGTGATGWILQGDVLQSLAPLIAARSDTFRIRAYGDTTESAGVAPTARAWCEAIVQRLPDPVTDGTALTEAELINPTHPFGRQFKILAFRWLSPDEI